MPQERRTPEKGTLMGRNVEESALDALERRAEAQADFYGRLWDRIMVMARVHMSAPPVERTGASASCETAGHRAGGAQGSGKEAQDDAK